MENILKIANTIKEHHSETIKLFNEAIEVGFPLLFGKTAKEFFSGYPTSEKTKVLSPIFYNKMEKVYHPHGLIPSPEVGKDYEWFVLDLEGKVSLSMNEEWTGNGYKKTNWHLLIKFEMDENMFIKKSFVCLVPLDECYSAWTEPKQKVNFSSLKLRNEDEDNIIVCVGSLSKKSKYLHPVLM